MPSYCACTAMLRSSGSNVVAPELLGEEAGPPGRVDHHARAHRVLDALRIGEAERDPGWRRRRRRGRDAARGRPRRTSRSGGAGARRRSRAAPGRSGAWASPPLRRSRRTARWRRRSSRSSRPTSGRTRPPRSSRGRRAPRRPRWSRAAGTRRCGSAGTARAPGGGPGAPGRASAVAVLEPPGPPPTTTASKSQSFGVVMVADRRLGVRAATARGPRSTARTRTSPWRRRRRCPCSAIHWTVWSKTSFV